MLLISSTISVIHPSGIFFSWLGYFPIPSSCIEVLPSSKKSHSSHFPPTQNLPSSSPSGLYTQSLLPLFSLCPALPHFLALIFSLFLRIVWIFLSCFYLILSCAYGIAWDVPILFVLIFDCKPFLKPFFFFSTFGAIFHVLFISSCLQISVEDLDSEDTCAVMYRTFTATNHMLLLVTEDTFPLCIRPSDELKASRSQLCFWLLLVNLILWSGWSKLSSSVLWV